MYLLLRYGWLSLSRLFYLSSTGPGIIRRSKGGVARKWLGIWLRVAAHLVQRAEEGLESELVFALLLQRRSRGLRGLDWLAARVWLALPHAQAGDHLGDLSQARLRKLSGPRLRSSLGIQRHRRSLRRVGRRCRCRPAWEHQMTLLLLERVLRVRGVKTLPRRCRVVLSVVLVFLFSRSGDFLDDDLLLLDEALHELLRGILRRDLGLPEE